MDLPSFAPPSAPPYYFDPKPQILYVADVPDWSFDRKGQDYRSKLPHYDIDIGFANPICHEKGLGHCHYREMEKQKHYDAVWHLHEFYFWSEEELGEYIKAHNKNNTLVLLTINQFYSLEEIELRRTRLNLYDAISVNNPYCWQNLKRAGFNAYYTPDGYPADEFCCEIPIEKRPFNVVFVSSKLWLEHKGYYILNEVEDQLMKEGVGFTEVIADSFNNKKSFKEMNDIYNQAQIFVCLSKSEGGPCTLQETAGCGLVPICTKVGYTEYLTNIFIVERRAEPFVETILYLRDNPDVLRQMSRGVMREAIAWRSDFTALKWGHFVEQALIRHRGIRLS